MTGRADRGSWLDGAAPGDSGPGGTDRHTRLGLPAQGPGSRARLGRRVAALGADWAASLAVSAVLFPTGGVGVFLLDGDPVATLGVFALENVVLVATLGHTLGHRLLGLRVRRVGARGTAAPGLVPALVRTALLCLVVPAVVWDADGRGLHDRAAGTLLVRR